MALRSAGRLEVWIPRPAASRAERPNDRRRGADGNGPGELHRQRPHLRRKARLAGCARRRRLLRPAQDRAADAGERASGAPASPWPAEGRGRTFDLDRGTERARRAVHSRSAEPHSLDSIFCARILAIACGYEDADGLDDPASTIACGRLPATGRDLCSRPIMPRWENAPTLREDLRQGGDVIAKARPRPRASILPRAPRSLNARSTGAGF